MKVLFTRFPFESEFGGIERVTIDLLDGLAKKGIDVSFWTNCEVFLEGKYKVSSVKYKKVLFPKPPVSKWSILKWFFGWFKYKKIAKDLAKEMKEEGVSHVVMLSFGEKLILTSFLLKSGIKVYWAEHERIRKWLTWNPFFIWYKFLSKKVKVISVSKVFQEDLKNIGIDSTVVENGVDTEFWKRKLRIDDYELQKLKLITVARLRPEKGIMELLKTIKESRIFDYELRIVGDGPEREKLEKFKNDNIKFLGGLSPEQVLEEYETANLAIFPSIERETSGLTPLEALSMEIPVIVSDQFGSIKDCESRIRDSGLEGVWIYKYDDLEKLGSLIVKFKDYKIERTRLRDFVEQNFSKQKMVENYISLFQK